MSDASGRAIQHIEFQNETQQDYNVAVCRVAGTGKLFVHLLGDQSEIHDEEVATVPAEYYEIVEIKERKS